MSQQNLTDADGPYIEVQSGPLPTQSDYGMLGPRERVEWREWWYPVHGLGDGFEFATRDLAVQSSREDGTLELRLLATGSFPNATCEASFAAEGESKTVGARRNGSLAARASRVANDRSAATSAREDHESKWARLGSVSDPLADSTSRPAAAR